MDMPAGKIFDKQRYLLRYILGVIKADLSKILAHQILSVCQILSKIAEIFDKQVVSND